MEISLFVDASLARNQRYDPSGHSTLSRGQSAFDDVILSCWSVVMLSSMNELALMELEVDLPIRPITFQMTIHQSWWKKSQKRCQLSCSTSRKFPR